MGLQQLYYSQSDSWRSVVHKWLQRSFTLFPIDNTTIREQLCNDDHVLLSPFRFELASVIVSALSFNPMQLGMLSI
jgi:hypothetical protein